MILYSLDNSLKNNVSKLFLIFNNNIYIIKFININNIYI